ncbi:MAG: hypothetical protein QF578_05780 [Alphaproteobacteria bacterium]|jgi:hypothetical protein|nr:hypothetical protein [Alphaproteobacteria bacterium]MDP6815988.1 hypothetical protein [Alphaproteobacteria bacterium]
MGNAAMTGRALIYHDLAQADRVLALADQLGQPVVLLTAPGAAAYGGPDHYLRIVELARRDRPEVSVEAILDCGDDAGIAQMALRLGWRSLVLKGKRAVRDKLRQIAERDNARILARPPKALDLNVPDGEIEGQCRAAWKLT